MLDESVQLMSVKRIVGVPAIDGEGNLSDTFAR